MFLDEELQGRKSGAGVGNPLEQIAQRLVDQCGGLYVTPEVGRHCIYWAESTMPIASSIDGPQSKCRGALFCEEPPTEHLTDNEPMLPRFCAQTSLLRT